MVRRSHVVMGFICVAIGNRHCTSGKLVAIRHNAFNKGTLPCTRELDAHEKHVRMTWMSARVSTIEVFCRDRLVQKPHPKKK